MALLKAHMSLFQWQVKKWVSHSFVKALRPETLNDIRAIGPEPNDSPLTLFESLMHNLNFGTYLVWLDETYGLEESWFWFRTIHKAYGLCVPSILSLFKYRVILIFTGCCQRE